MSRNPRIEAIHQARYDRATCAPEEEPACEAKLNKLLDEAIGASRSHTSRRQLLDLLYEDYREYLRMMRRKDWPRL